MLTIQPFIETTMGKLESAKNVTTNFIKDNVGLIAAGAGGLAVGAALGAVAATQISKRKSAKRRKSKSRNVRKRIHRNRKRRYKYARTAGKRKDRSHKRIRMTKNGQPYIIMASGKARFISKKGARMSRKRKGGRY